MNSERDGFRPDLEGLRAVAVVLVVLYHAGLTAVGGGYVGVDVFFVLSGFLITGLLLRELERTGTVSLPAFYARRARRLLPAALIVLAVTVLAGALLLPPLQMPDVTRDSAAAALYVSNIRFALNATDYLQAQAAPSPVLHFWSLGVEEQFYVFWPAIVLLVAGAARFGRGRDLARGRDGRPAADAGRGTSQFGRRIGLTAALIGAVSLALAIWLTDANEPWAFYSLPTRAWELGLGALLAVGAGRLARIPRPAATLAGWAGLGLVTFAGLTLNVATPFPGTAALLPTVGSALVIVGGFAPAPLAVGRLLGTAVPRYLGRISYSLYLWHWPLLVLPAASLGRALGPVETVALVALAIGLAALTQRFVENPFRHGRLIGVRPRRNLGLALAGSLVVAVGAVGLGNASVAGLASSPHTSESADEAALSRILGAATPSAASTASAVATSASPNGGQPASSGSPGSTPGATATATPTPTASPPAATIDVPVPAGLRPSLLDAATDLPAPYSGCNVGFGATQSPSCVYGNPKGTTTVALFGDSHALSWFPAVDRIAKARGWRLINLTKSACGSADVLQWLDALNRAYTECSQWRSNSIARIAAEHAQLVILTNSRATPIIVSGGKVVEGPPAIAPWQAGLERTAARLNAIPGVKIAVIGDTGRSAFDVPVCLSKHRNSILACATPYTSEVSADWEAAAAAAAQKTGGTFIDPTPWVCPTRPCPPVIGDFLVYRDQHHLTTPFATALADYLAAELPSL